MFEASDSIEEPPMYGQGDIVWVKLGNYWWPGEVKKEEDLPSDLVADFKKPPKVIVQFFDEDSYEYINKWSNIHPYNCERKSEFIKKGMAKYRGKQTHMSKFPKDIGIAEEKTNGDPNILSQSEFLPAKKIDLDEIFGTAKTTPTTKKVPKEIYQPIISHRRFLGNDDYMAQILRQYPGKDREPDSDSEDIQKMFDGPQINLTCEACSFHTKRLGVWLNHGKTHLDGSFAAAKRKSKISEYDFVESDSEVRASKPSKPKQRKKPVKKEIKEESVTNWLDEWNVSDEEMEGNESLMNEQGQESLNDQAKEKEDGIAASIEVNTAKKVENEATNNHTVVSTSSHDNTKDDIKNCFDFDDDEEVDFGFLSPVTEGRKIPRVIPEKPKASITDLLELSEKEDVLVKEKNLVTTEKSVRPEDTLETDLDLNRKEILRVSQSFNRALAVDDSIENTFKEIMDVTEVPALGDLGQTLKPEQNFHDARAVKFPDKGGTSAVKETSSSSKIGTSRKRFVTSFDDFEAGFRKINDDESKKEDTEKQKPQESTTSKMKLTVVNSGSDTPMTKNSETPLKFPSSSDDSERTDYSGTVDRKRKSLRLAVAAKEILDVEMEAINKALETDQNLASEGIIKQPEISLEQLTRDLEGTSDNEEDEDQNKTRRKSIDFNKTSTEIPSQHDIVGRFDKIHKKTKSKKNRKDELKAVKPQEDGNTTISKPVQVEKQRIIKSNKVDNQAEKLDTMAPDVHKQKVPMKSSHKDTLKQTLRRGRSNKSFENESIEVPQLEPNNEISNNEIVHKSKKSQLRKSEMESFVSEPEMPLVCEDAVPDAAQIEEKLVKATNDIVEDIVDISLKKRSHHRIGKYKSDIEKRSPSRRLTRHETGENVKRKNDETLMQEALSVPASTPGKLKYKKHKSELSIPETTIDDKLTESVDELEKSFVDSSTTAEKNESSKQTKIEKDTQISEKITEKKDASEKATTETSLTSRRHAKSYEEKMPQKSDKKKSGESVISGEQFQMSEPEKPISVLKKNKSQKRSDAEKEAAIGSATETEDMYAKSVLHEPIQSTESEGLNSKVNQSAIIEPVLLEKSPRRRHRKSRWDTEESASGDQTTLSREDKPVGCIDDKLPEVLVEVSPIEPEIPSPTVLANAEMKDLEAVTVPIKNQHLEDFIEHQLICTTSETCKKSELDTTTELIPEAHIETVVDAEMPKDVNPRRGRSKNKQEEIINKINLEKSIEVLKFLSESAKSEELCLETTKTESHPVIPKSVELHEKQANSNEELHEKQPIDMDISSIPLPNSDIDVSKIQEDLAVSPKPNKDENKDKKWKPTNDDAKGNDGGRRLRSFRRVSSHVSKEYLPEVCTKSPPHVTPDLDRPEFHEADTTNLIPTEEDSKLISVKTPGIVVDKHYRGKPKGGRTGKSRSRWDVVSFPEEPLADTNEDISIDLPVSTKNELPAIIQENSLGSLEVNDKIVTLPSEEDTIVTSDIKVLDAENIVSVETVATEPPQEVVEQKIESIIEPELLADIPLPPEPSPIKQVEESPVKHPKKHKSARRSYRRKSASEKNKSNHIEDSVSSIPTIVSQLDFCLESIPLPVQDNQCSVSEQVVDNALCEVPEAMLPHFATESVVVSSNCQSDESKQEITLEKATLNDVLAEPTKENVLVEKLIEQPVIEISADKPLEIAIESLNNVDAMSAGTDVTQEPLIEIQSEAPVVCEVLEGAIEAMETRHEIEKETGENDVESTKQEIMQATEVEVLKSNSQTVVDAEEKIENEKIETAVEIEKQTVETDVESTKQEIMQATEVEVLKSNTQTVVDAEEKIENEKIETAVEIEKQTVETDVESTKQEIMQATEVEVLKSNTQTVVDAEEKIENEKIETAVESTKQEIMQVVEPELLELNTQTIGDIEVGLVEAGQKMEDEKIKVTEQEIIQCTTEVKAPEFKTQSVEIPQIHEESVVEVQQIIEKEKIESNEESMKQTSEETQISESNTQDVDKLHLDRENVIEAQQKIENEKSETHVESTDQKIMQATEAKVLESKTQTLGELQLYGDGVVETAHKIEIEEVETSEKFIEQEIMSGPGPEVILEKVQLQDEGVIEAQLITEKEKIETSVENIEQEIVQAIESERSELNSETVKKIELHCEGEIEIVQAVEPEAKPVEKLQIQGEDVIEAQQKIEEEKIEFIGQEIEQVTAPEESKLNMQTVEPLPVHKGVIDTLEVQQNIEKGKFETPVESKEQEIINTTVAEVLESKMQTVEQVISDTVEQIFRKKEETVVSSKECSSKPKKDGSSKTQVQDDPFRFDTEDLEIKGSSLAALAAASVILENQERAGLGLEKYFQLEDIPLPESSQDISKITKEKLKLVPPKKNWPRHSRQRESEVEAINEKIKSDPFDYIVSEKTEQPSQEATAPDSEIILPPKKAKRISEASFLQSSFSEDHISPEHKSDIDMSFPIFDDSFMSTSLRNNIEGIINKFNTSGSTSSEPPAADKAKCVLPKKKRIDDSIEKLSENMPQAPKKKMQKLFENSQIVEKSTTELPLMSPLAKKKSFLFQQEEFKQSKIEPKTSVEETKNEINVDEFLNISTKRKKRKSSSYETCIVKKEKIDESDLTAHPGLNLSETEVKSENALISAAGIDIKKQEIIVPTLNEAELVPISVAPTVMTEKDLADTQVEITTTEVISKKAPSMSLESTLKNIISGKKIGEGSSKRIGEVSSKRIGEVSSKRMGEGSSKKIGEGRGTKFTSKAMLKEFDQPPFRSQAYIQKSDLLDILEGNSNSSTNSSGSEQKFKTSFDNYDTTNVVQGIIDFEEAIPSSQIVLTSKGPDSVIMDSPRLLERLSMATGPKPKVQKVMVQSDIKAPKKLALPKLAKPMGVPKAGQKILIKTGKPGGTVMPKITGSKPIILSEQILRPATATTSTAIQPQGVKRQYEDIEDVETAFIIPKISRKTEEIEEVASKPPDKPARSRGSKSAGKAKIIQQTIIKPKVETVPQTATVTASTSTQFQQTTQTIQDEAMFDISNMPVVLSEDLTPECIQNMPVVLSENILPQTSVMPVAARAPQHQDKILAALSKKLVPGGGKQIIFKTTQPMSGASTSMAVKTVTKSRLLQNPSSTLQGKIQKTGTPALLATGTTPDGKQAKYVLVPPAGTVSALPQMKAVQKTIVKKQPAIHQKVVASGIAPAQDQIVGNKIMIVTNSQGQQTRTMLTPQQQIAWMQTQGGVKKTIIKGAIPKALLDSATPATATAIAGPSGIVVPKTVSTVSLGATPTVTSHAGLLMPVKTTPFKKGTPRTKQQKTVLIKNQMGETVRRIQGPNSAELDRQVAEQLEAIKAIARQQQAYRAQEATTSSNRQSPSSSVPSTSSKQVPRRFTKKVEQKVKLPTSTVTQGETQNSPDITGLVPALAPLSPQTRVSAVPKPAFARKAETSCASNLLAKAPEVRQQTTVPVKTEVKPESTLPDPNTESRQVVLRDTAGNLSTVTVGQILALPNDAVDGQQQTYVLVKVDENGALHPLNNDALMSLDPSLGLGPEINNVILDVDHDQGTVSASKPPEVIDPKQKPTKQELPVKEELQPSEQLQTLKDEEIVAAEPIGQQETSIAVEQQLLIGEGVLPGDAGGQQLMITGDQLATQKFIESLSNGSIDLGSILANAESGSVIVQTDGQQLLIRTHTVPQAMLGETESTEGGGNPMFATHKPNQDILAAALADTDVFQPTLELPLKSRGQVSPPGGSSSPGGGPGLYPMNAGNVLETSLTLNAPIMTPLEVPTNNNKKIDDEAEILHPVPKNVDLPITITDPNIAQTVAHQQAVGLLELSLPISEVGPITGMNSPSFSFSLPTLDDSTGIQKSFSSSMPLLTEDVVESENSASSDQMRVSKDLSAVPTSFSSSFGSIPMLSEAIESTREEVVKTSGYNEFIGNMLDISPDDVIDDSESSESRKSRRSRKHSIMDQGLAILGGKMCSSLSEPPPDMFDFDSLTGPQKEEEISSDVSSIQEPETLSLNSENSDDIPLQPPIVASLSDLKGPDDDSASSGSDDKHA